MFNKVRLMIAQKSLAKMPDFYKSAYTDMVQHFVLYLILSIKLSRTYSVPLPFVWLYWKFILPFKLICVARKLTK